MMIMLTLLNEKLVQQHIQCLETYQGTLKIKNLTRKNLLLGIKVLALVLEPTKLMLKRISRKRRKKQDILDQSSVSFATAAMCVTRMKDVPTKILQRVKKRKRKRDFVSIV